MPNPENIEKHKWKPGQTGNAKGNHKRTKHRKTLFKKWLNVKETVENPITAQQEELTQLDIVALSLLKEARKGNTKAIEILLDGLFGKVEDKVDQKQSGSIHITREIITKK